MKSKEFSELSERFRERIEKLVRMNEKNEVENLCEELERLNEDEEIVRETSKRLRRFGAFAYVKSIIFSHELFTNTPTQVLKMWTLNGKSRITRK